MIDLLPLVFGRGGAERYMTEEELELYESEEETEVDEYEV